jgi:hypothetical protein
VFLHANVNTQSALFVTVIVFSRTLVYLILTEDTGKTCGTRARILVGSVVTSGTVLTWRRNTFIVVHPAVVAAVTIAAHACVLVHVVEAPTILTARF